MLIDHDHPDVRKPAADPVLLRLIIVVLVLEALVGVYLLFARNIPAAMAEDLTPRRAGGLFGLVVGIVIPFWGAVGLMKKRAALRAVLLVWLPFHAFQGGRDLARGFARTKSPDWGTLAWSWALVGGFWMLVFVYLMQPSVRRLFEPVLAAAQGQARGRGWRQRPPRRAGRPPDVPADDEPCDEVD